MTGTKKKNRNKKNKSKNPPKARRPKAKDQPQGITPNIAFNNIDTVCSKFVGTREDHLRLQISVTVLKGKIKALAVAEERIKELEAGYDSDELDPDNEDSDAEDEAIEESDDDDIEDEDDEYGEDEE